MFRICGLSDSWHRTYEWAPNPNRRPYVAPRRSAEWNNDNINIIIIINNNNNWTIVPQTAKIKELYVEQFFWDPGKILSPFLPTAPLQYVPKILFTKATIERLTTNKTKNALNN